jgi:hypothetical protein
MTDMSMLTHPHRPLQRAPHSSASREALGAREADARRAKIRQFCLCAFTVLLAVGALTGVIALKAAIYLSRLHLN